MIKNNRNMRLYTLKGLKEIRNTEFIKKWRASGKNYSFISNPTIKEIKERANYSRACEKYVKFLIGVVIISERRLYKSGILLRCESYYKKRYDLTSVEYKILKESIRDEANKHQ